MAKRIIALARNGVSLRNSNFAQYSIRSHNRIFEGLLFWSIAQIKEGQGHQ